MGEEDVDPREVRRQGEAERADARCRRRGSASRRRRGSARRRRCCRRSGSSPGPGPGPSRARPRPGPSRPTSCGRCDLAGLLVDRPKITIAPGGAAGGADDRHRARRDPVLDAVGGADRNSSWAGPALAAAPGSAAAPRTAAARRPRRTGRSAASTRSGRAGRCPRTAGRSARRPLVVEEQRAVLATRKAGVVTLVRRFRARISSSGFCGPDIGSQHCSTDCAVRHQRTAVRATGRPPDSIGEAHRLGCRDSRAAPGG